MKRISLLTIFAAMSFISCGTAVEAEDRGVDPFALYYGRGERQGDPWTGVGFVEGITAERYLRNMVYRLDYEDNYAVALRTQEVVKRVYIPSIIKGDTVIPEHFIYVIVKPSEWAQQQ